MIRTYPSCPDYIAAMSLREAREWRRALRTDRVAHGAHPQLDANIAAVEHHIDNMEEE